MPETIVNDVLNNGMIFKVYVPVEECPDIERFVDNYIGVSISNTVDFIALLKRVSTWTQKKGKNVIGIYKELYLMIETISCQDGVVRLPDRKDQILDEVKIKYLSE